MQAFDAERASSFLALSRDDATSFSVKVKAHAPVDPDLSIKLKIDMMEHKRAEQAL